MHISDISTLHISCIYQICTWCIGPKKRLMNPLDSKTNSLDRVKETVQTVQTSCLMASRGTAHWSRFGIAQLVHTKGI